MFLRIKTCAQLSENDFVNAHKLFAQLYYKFESKNQPLLLRDSPNPSLSQALAGTFGILAKNTDYLKAQVKNKLFLLNFRIFNKFKIS